MAQLSLPPWVELYDTTTNDVVTTTSNSTLNGKLYSKLLLALDGNALKSIVSRKHLRANGILLLKELIQTYRPKNVPEVIAFKTSEFWGNTKRFPSESVDEYYNHFHELLEDLADADEQISPKSAIRHFIFTLGSDFEALQNNFRLENLPAKWNTQDWPTILNLCRDYYHSIKPQGFLKKDSSHSQGFDREAHQKSIRSWFLNPSKFSKDLEKEQQKFPDKCLYHLSKTHTTENCFVKKECDKQLQTKLSTNSPSISTAHLCHMTEDIFEDPVNAVDSAECADCVDDPMHNDTNEADLLYFACVTNHYLRLARKISADASDQVHHKMPFPIIADSGANFHMFREHQFFDTLSPTTGTVILGDGKTSLSILGVGTVKCYIGENVLSIPNVRYVPDLSESIYSLFQHIQLPNHALHSTYEDGLFIQFPNFKTKAIIGTHDIYLDAKPFHSSGDSTTTCFQPGDIGTSSNFCHHLQNFQQELCSETKYIDTILQRLRQYYAEVKSKRQLNLEVPAGFRKITQHQKDYNEVSSSQILPTSSSLLNPVADAPCGSVTSNIDSTSTLIDDAHTEVVDPSTTPSSLIIGTPILRSVDKPSASLPRTATMSEDFLRACVSFLRVDTIKQHLSNLYCDTIKLASLPADAVLDYGDLSTIRKSARNTTPVPSSTYFGEVMHADIVFGPEVAVGNVHYGLLFTDRFSHMTYLYPLQNLQSDIQKQIETFFSHIGVVPHRLITDFDLKLIGGRARTYLNSLLVHVNAAPAYRQDKNVLAERHWQTMVSMARNWLASAELPSTFWFYAVKRAAEVCNYFPTKMDDGSFCTPFELVHGKKPDLRVLFRLFGLAAVRRERVGDTSLNKFDPQSIPMIAVGRCPVLNGLQFYNPANGSFVSSIDYKFQPNVTSGACFGFRYQPGTFIYRLDESSSIFTPKFLLDLQVLIHTHSPPHTATIVGIPSYDRPDIYTVKFADGSLAEYSDTDNLMEAAPVISHTTKPAILPHWIQGGANATLILHNMSKPRHGKFFLKDSGHWVFCPGNSSDTSSGILTGSSSYMPFPS